MSMALVRADGCVKLGPAVSCDGFSRDCPIRIQSHVHTDHMKDFERSKGHQRYLVCSHATYDLLCDEYNADLPLRRRQWAIMPMDGTYRRVGDVNAHIALFPSGHMIGSAISAVKYADGSHYVYTSDFAWPLPNLPTGPDVLIVDATYGNPANIRNYNPAEVVGRFQQVVQELRTQGSIVVTGHRGRLQYALQLMADLFDGPYIVSRHVAATLNTYMHHQGFHVPVYEMSTQEAIDILNDGSFISLIESRDRSYLHSTQSKSRIYLSAFMVPREEPVKVLSNGVTRLALTDHADFEGTIELIEAIQPKHVIADGTRAGNAEALASFVETELRIPATSFAQPTSKEWGMH